MESWRPHDSLPTTRVSINDQNVISASKMSYIVGVIADYMSTCQYVSIRPLFGLSTETLHTTPHPKIWGRNTNPQD